MRLFPALLAFISFGVISGFFTGCASHSSDNKNAYLFTYFTDNGSGGLRLAWSEDGYDWMRLGWGGLHYLKPEVGESKLMRDPCVARGPDGTYHMVWTTSWNGKTIGYASTKDFLSWSEQQAIPIMAGIDGTVNCWAPEIIYNEEQQNFLIYWSSTVEGRYSETSGNTNDKYNHRLYYSTTTDFKTFTSPQIFYDPGFSVIDGTLLPAQGKWFLIVKDERDNPEPKKNIRIAAGNHATGPFTVPPGPPISDNWVEGPAAIQIGKDYLIYFDRYTKGQYGAIRSIDLQNWEDVSAKISLPSNARHGSVIEVPIEIIDRLRAQDMFISRPPPNTTFFP
jgi:hypothetical protein